MTLISLLLACQGEADNPAPSAESFCALVESMGGPDTGVVVVLDCGGWMPDACSDGDAVLFTTEARVQSAERVCESAGYSAGWQTGGSCIGDTGATVQTTYYECGEAVAR